MLPFLLAALGALVTGGSYAAWRLSPVARSARGAKRAVGAVGDEVAATRGVLDERAGRLAADAATYVEGAREAERAATGVEKLKEAGASGVRWSALQAAGYDSLADVAGVPARRLLAVQGIGPVGARKLSRAARRLEEALAERPVSPPTPDLEARGAPELVQSGLDVIDARTTLGDVPRRLAAEHEALAGRLGTVRRDNAWLRWVFGAADREAREGKVSRARRLAHDAVEVLETGVGAEARARRAQLAERAATPADRRALGKAYRERFAELVAVMEGVLGPEERTLATPDLRSGTRLPEEIVQRVEALALVADGLSVVLRRYQDFGARYLLVQGRTILGDDMGLGKTMQSLAAMVHLHDTGTGHRFLVVAPATVVANWAREVGTRTSLPCYVLHGSRREEDLALWLESGGVAVTSYATLRRLELRPLLPEAIDLLVADEAHYLKNPEASRTAAVAELLEASRRACLMTGTPIENTLDEFRRLVHLVRPGLLPDVDGGGDESGVYLDPYRFQQDVAAVYLRRNQHDVLHELPERLEKEEWVELGGHEQGAYAEAVEGGNIMAMRRAATIGPWRRSRRSRPRSAKLDRLAEIVDEHAQLGRKVLVFSFFLDVLDAVARRVPSVGAITGKVAPADREAVMERFREHDGPAVLLGQITAAGVGLNLQAASVVVLLEPQWKPSTEEQAIARAHRMGQTEKVVVHRLLCRDSVDERIVELLAGKQELFERYARPSAIKAASTQATETSLSRLVVETEQARLREQAGAPSETAG